MTHQKETKHFKNKYLAYYMTISTLNNQRSFFNTFLFSVSRVNVMKIFVMRVQCFIIRFYASFCCKLFYALIAKKEPELRSFVHLSTR